jgi:ATP-dependent RNA helicase SUPV3L1/SUV3
MGMNLPIKRIIFSTFAKFYDNKEFILTNSEIKQIAGRAGRYKRFPVGFASALSKESERFEILSEAMSCDLDQKTNAMVGPDLDIFQQVNKALEVNSLPILSLVEFLRLFNTMNFEKPFYCVDLKEMIEVAEMVENSDRETKVLSASEIFGFSCAPVNLGLVEHVQYFMYIINRFVQGLGVEVEKVETKSNNIDYLETSIKCVELFQWLSRHFNDKHFEYELDALLSNKGEAVEKLNTLLGDKLLRHCSSCGVLLEPKFKFNICEKCFSQKRGARRGGRGRLNFRKSGNKSDKDNQKSGPDGSRRKRTRKSKSTGKDFKKSRKR